MGSFTVTFTGNSSILKADFLPEIILDENHNYSCALLDFTTYNSIPNVVQNKNNKFQFKFIAKDKKTLEKTIYFDNGSYEVSDVLKYLKSQLLIHKIILQYDVNVATSKVKLLFDTRIECIDDSILSIIGFSKKSNRVFEANKPQWSDQIVKITDIDVIRIECDLIYNAYINGENCHTLHQFSNSKVEIGHKFIEIPEHFVYLPVKYKQIRSIQISVVDQNGNLINFQNEQITCRIHIKKDI